MTGRSIGSFGTRREHPDDELTFEYFGETMRVNPTFSGFALLKRHQVDPDDPGEGLRIMRSMIDDLLHPDDADRFVELGAQNGQEFVDLQEIVTAVIESIADRPTQPRSDSSDSRPTTDTSSPAADFSLALEALPPNRPDLQLIVMQAQEYREEQAEVRSAG
jgi:hypothetical protein